LTTRKLRDAMFTPPPFGTTSQRPSLSRPDGQISHPENVGQNA
jgi:hypothetical protein